MSRINSSFTRIGLVCFLVSVLVFVCFWPSKVSAGSGLPDSGIPGVPKTICLSSVPRLENFPDIALDFRPLDSSITIVSGLSSTDIQAQENNSAPVPVNVNIAPVGIGLNVYFVIDTGNRTDLTLVAATLQSLSPMLQDNVDEVTIISDDNNGSNYLLNTTKSLSDFQKAIQNLPLSSLKYTTINNGLTQALKYIKGQNYGCSHSNLIIVMSGGETLNNTNNYQQYIDDANAAWTKVHFFHYPNPTSHVLFSQPVFENLANGTNGLYRQILNKAEIAASLPMLGLDREREQYTATYRTIIGDSGDRNVSLLYQNRDITRQVQTYSITISNPTITITSPADGIVIQQPSSGSDTTTTDTTDLVNVEFSLSWPDGHKRNIKSADLVVTSPSGTNTAMSISAGAPLEFNWNIGEYTRQNFNTLSIKVTATDEFGLPAASKVVTIKIIYITPPPPLNTWLLYSLYAIVAILLVVLIIMGKRIKTLATTGVVGRFLGEVRKTFVGGRRKGKPYASFKVLDGPASMVNQDIKIYTESVKLGRDPQKSDLTFYTPDSNSSISGLHCRIERVGGSWRIVALSSSGSETFVEDQAIPFNEPYPLQSGQTVRMGYLAQQPVVFQFNVEQGSEQQPKESDAEEDVRKTTFISDGSDEDLVPPDPQTHAEDSTKESTKDTDDLFDEFRNR